MIGALLPACAGAPENRRKDDNRKQEKSSGDFEKYLPADVAERLEKA